ncbi:hypothetical protein ACFQV8_12230 [Pseudonocardia benzenivorans]
MSTSSAGAVRSTEVSSLIRTGLPGSARPATSTRSGSPVGASAQTSTCATVVSGSTGVTRRPTADRPATRRAGSAVTGSAAAAARMRRARSGGSRSAARGSRSDVLPVTRVSRPEPKSHNVSVSPRW